MLDTSISKQSPESEIYEHDLTHLSKEAQLALVKKQNERLRQELKVINEFLTKAIAKKKESKPKYGNNIDLRDDTIRQELLNANKQIDFYKKELAKANTRIERDYKPEIVESMKQDLIQKDRDIAKLTSENKALQKVQREQSKALKDIYEEESYKKQIQQLTEENKSLREQLKETKKNAPTLPVIVRHIIQEHPKTPTETRRANSSNKFKDDSEKIAELEKNIQILQKIRKQYDIQLEGLYTRIKHLEEQNAILQSQLTEKNKDFNNLAYKVPHTQVTSTIQSTQKKSNQSYDLGEFSSTPNPGKDPQRQRNLSVDPKRDVLDVQPKTTSHARQQVRSGRKVVKVQISPEKKENGSEKEIVETGPLPPPQVKHLEKGTINTNNHKFTDQDILKGYYQFKIHGLKIWTNEENQIKGLQAVYQSHSGTLTEGLQNIVTGNQNFTIHSTDFLKFDYVKSIGGKIGLKGNIEYLEIQSQQGRNFTCGIEQIGQRKFKFEISDIEVPVCMFGSLDLKSQGSILASLGFEVIRDEVAEEF